MLETPSSSSSVSVSVELSNNTDTTRSEGVAQQIAPAPTDDAIAAVKQRCVIFCCWLLMVGGIAIGFAFAVQHEVVRHEELAQTMCNQEYAARPLQIGLVGGARQLIVWELGHQTTDANGTTAFVTQRRCTTYDVPPVPGAVPRFMYANNADGCCFEPDTQFPRGWEAFGLVILGIILCCVCLSVFNLRRRH